MEVSLCLYLILRNLFQIKQISINKDFHQDFEKQFRQYHSGLCKLAYSKVFDIQIAEDIVQDVFLHLWSNEKTYYSILNMKSYLNTSVINKCYDHNRKALKSKVESVENTNLTVVSGDINKETELLTNELEELISSSIEQLPPKCKTIFKLSRFSKMPYKEIANSLEISQKAVEKQMTKALKHLRLSVFRHVD